MYVCMYVCMFVCLYVCMFVCLYVYMYVCMYTCIHVYMYSSLGDFHWIKHAQCTLVRLDTDTSAQPIRSSCVYLSKSKHFIITLWRGSRSRCIESHVGFRLCLTTAVLPTYMTTVFDVNVCRCNVCVCVCVCVRVYVSLYRDVYLDINLYISIYLYIYIYIYTYIHIYI